MLLDMSFHYRTHDDIHVHCTPAHIAEAECQSTTRCTLARMGREVVGAEVQVAYDRKTGDVRMIWQKDSRTFDGIIEPAKRATQILLLTDTAKRELVGTCPIEGIPLIVTKVRSRPIQVRTPEQRDAELARRQELARLRAEGLAPPAKPRGPYERGITRLVPSRMGRAYISEPK